MRTKFVISTQYQPLVESQAKNSFLGLLHSGRFIRSIPIKKADLEQRFEESKKDPLIACDNLDDAEFIAALLLKGHNTTPDFIESGVKLFGSPVIYKVEFDEGMACTPCEITPEILYNYMNTETIPLYTKYNELKETEKKRFQKFLDEKGSFPAWHVSGLELSHVQEAIYIDASGKGLRKIDFTEPMSLKQMVFG